MKLVWISLISLLFFYHPYGLAQIDSIQFTETAALEFPPPGFLQFKSSFTSIIDRQDRDYLYSANMNYGLGIYDISEPNTINLIQDMDISFFNDLDVSNIKQRDNLLFLAIGDFQTTNNPASGLAIVDITNPEAAFVTDVWDSTYFTKGVSHLLIEGDYAYLSVMDDGLVILDISMPEDIDFVSHMVPTLAFPEPSDGHHQGRGLAFRNDTLFYCFDRGGLRLIDVSNKAQPIELDRYINTGITENAVAAYNDVVIKDHYAFVSVDYCGLEILDFSTSPISLVEWYNPWGCSQTNWAGADLHGNELIIRDDLLFMSAGNSELLVFDISDPKTTHKIGGFYALDNEEAAYGLDVYNNQVALSYLSNPLNIPFVGNWGGLKLLDYDLLVSTIEEPNREIRVDVFPNPTEGYLEVTASQPIQLLEVYDLQGRLLLEETGTNTTNQHLEINNLKAGAYLLIIHAGDQEKTYQKFLKN